MYTALARPGNPMWKNVESPRVAKIGREAGLPSARKAMAIPEATVMEPPMQTLVSTAFWGGLVISIVSLLLGLGGEGVGSLLVGAAMMMATMILSCAVFIFRDCFEPPEQQDAEPATLAESAPQEPQI